MDEQYRQRIEEIAREMIRRGEFDHPVNPDRDATLNRNNQDDSSLRYSIRDIPTFDGKGDSLPHTHMMEFGDFLANVTSIAFESKDDPTQMTKIVIYNYILYYIQKTIHSKLICTNVHS